MAKDIKGRGSEDKEINLLEWLREKHEEKRKIFMKNSHGVYRDEKRQWKAEIEMRFIDEILDVIS
jgi:hypothetical protein